MCESVFCDRCRRIVLASEARFEAPLMLCKRCFQKYYAYCAVCGCFAERELLHYSTNGDKGYCDECYIYYLKNG